MHRRRDHVLYLGMAVVSAALVFAGFARTFYLRGLFPSPPIQPLFLVHGIVFTSWFVIFIAQTALVAAGRTDLHRRVGLAGIAIAAAMVVFGPVVAVQAARRGMDLRFLLVPLVDIVVFGTLVAEAYRRRRASATHKRLMLVATIAIYPPAIARLPSDFFAGPLEVFGTNDLFLLACVAYDTVARRRLHPAFLWSSLFLVASQPLRIWAGDTDAWLSVAQWLVRW